MATDAALPLRRSTRTRNKSVVYEETNQGEFDKEEPIKSEKAQDKRIGKSILKHFPGQGKFTGVIKALVEVEHENKILKCYRVEYEDGDVEDIPKEKISYLIKSFSSKSKTKKTQDKGKLAAKKQPKDEKSKKRQREDDTYADKENADNNSQNEVKKPRQKRKKLSAKKEEDKKLSVQQTEELWKKQLNENGADGLGFDENTASGEQDKRRQSISEYEKQRRARIQENAKVLQSLGLDVEINNIANMNQEAVKRKITKKVATARTARVKRPLPPRRTSSRLRGEAAKLSHNPTDEQLAQVAADHVEEFGVIKSCEEYWTEKGVKPVLILKEGHKFTGWVNEDIRKRCGIAQDSTTAWESNGGGTFSFKNPTGKKKKTGAGSAKEVARSMLRKNPNQYFYRHTAPGLEHWMGDWTEEEHKLFIETAKKYGVGNKWGLFATHIGHRVGYQCSNYYRAYFVGQGIIWDPNFSFTKYGETIWKGGKGGWGN